MLWSAPMDMPIDDSADPFTETGLRDRARRGLLATPTQRRAHRPVVGGAAAQHLGLDDLEARIAENVVESAAEQAVGRLRRYTAEADEVAAAKSGTTQWLALSKRAAHGKPDGCWQMFARNVSQKT